MGTAVFFGLNGYLTIFSSFQYGGSQVKGSTIAQGAYYAWAINGSPGPIQDQYPPSKYPGSGFIFSPAFLMPLRFGLKRAMVPIATPGS
jgi:hypothetical protein